MTADATTVPANLLRTELSPYLLQHADNPVHWRPWGAAALAEAQARGCPILLSVGYAACHWCHVMAHESFEDPQTAELMNTLFVNIKVDREERPDIDQVYMSALHALGEQGGWPLAMFLTPAGDPFWGGTYFPPTPRYGRPSFRQVLQGIAEAWANRQDSIRGNIAGLQKALTAMAASNPGDVPTPDVIDGIAQSLLGMVDVERGGLRGAPKFPNPPIFRFLWQHARRGAQPAMDAGVHHLLRSMSQGGIYDHLGGGYARYSTDADWLAPHFEKMLYDNAQILDLLALAHAATPDPLYVARAEETVGWLLRDMMAATDPDGRAAFAASEDADSEGEEGRFYVWTQAEVDAELGLQSAAFSRAYDVTPPGNWEGHTILRRVTPRGDPAAEAALAQSRALLFARRALRIRPARDDKVLADWNGLMIAALCRAALVFDRPEWRDHAARAFDFVLANMAAPDGRVQHAWRLGRIAAAGLLEDQAAMARAALALFQATAEPRYLAVTVSLAEAALHWFTDADGSFFVTASDASDVPAARPRSAGDNATPGGNGMMAEVMATLFHLTGDARWRGHAEAVLAAFGGAGRGLGGMPGLLAAAELLEDGITIVVTGPRDDSGATALWQAALATPDPATLVLRAADPADLAQDHPAYGKEVTRVAAYVCRAGACSLPVDSPMALTGLLRRAA